MCCKKRIDCCRVDYLSQPFCCCKIIKQFFSTAYISKIDIASLYLMVVIIFLPLNEVVNMCKLALKILGVLISHHYNN